MLFQLRKLFLLEARKTAKNSILSIEIKVLILHANFLNHNETIKNY